MRICLLLGVLALLTTAQAVGAQTSGPSHKPGGFHSPPMFAEQRWNLTLSESGAYYYHCHPHPWMTGTIAVAEGGAERVIVKTVNYAFAPTDVRIAPGGTVEFLNEDNDTHYVTETLPPSDDSKKSPGPSVVVGVAAALVGLGIVARSRAR